MYYKMIATLLTFGALIGLLVFSAPRNSPTSCAYTTCGYGSYCTEENGQVACKCPPICMTLVAEKPICGSDGNTYAGLCAMEHEACIKRLEVTKAYDGECHHTEPSVAPA